MSRNEWYTPRVYIEAAREVMDDIDLDPASCEEANRFVRAPVYYTKEQNGLLLPWSGKIWLNPPYGRINPERTGETRSYQLLFAQKLWREWHAGHVEQAILLLLGNACFMRWFEHLWNFPVCFHTGHIVFHTPGGGTNDFGFGSLFVYLGSHVDQFIQVFSRFGRVVCAVDGRVPPPVPQELWG